MDSRERKKQKDAATSVKVELPHLTQPREGHILHEQEYNTGHGIQAIPNEIRTEIWTQPSQPEVQQKPVIYLFPADTLEREYGVSGPSAPAASQPPKPATEAELKLIWDMRRRNPKLGLAELWRRLKQRGYNRRPESLF